MPSINLTKLFQKAAGNAGKADDLVVPLNEDDVLAPIAEACAEVMKKNLLAGLYPDGTSPPPLKPDTIRRKHGNTTRGVRTGHLANSINAHKEGRGNGSEIKWKWVVTADEHARGQLWSVLAGQPGRFTTDTGSQEFTDAVQAAADTLAGNK